MFMKRPWIGLAAVALAGMSLLAAGCGPDGSGTGTGDGGTGADASSVGCKAGVDTDGDGIDNATECALGLDPAKFDTDGDGASDGRERMYGKICVAGAGGTQMRPPMACTMDSECSGGTCKGLDPLVADSDGDGVPDGQEDRLLDGVIDAATGETDPRLTDTDGDGVTDGMGGLDICRPSGLATVTQVSLQGGSTQVGHDPAWGTGTPVMGGNGTGVVLDDAAANAAGAVYSVLSVGADSVAEATRIEGLLTAALGTGTTAVLVGQVSMTHEMQPARTSTYRVARATSASALRDATVMPFSGVAAPAGTAVGAGSEFIVELTTVRRASGPAMGRTDVAIVVSLAADYNDTAKKTSIRSSDLINTTGIAESGKGLGVGCNVFRATQSAVADFLWTVDTSGSMGDDQLRLANAGTRFFTQMQAAGVDFRVAVIEAGSTTLNIDNPGLTFISGGDAAGPRKLCEQVTSTSLNMPCPQSPGETFNPYPFSGGQEEPTAAAVLAHDILKRRTAAGEMNMDRRFRTGAKIVTFHVTDEPGSNDFSRYFDMTNAPDNMLPWGTAYNAASLANIIGYFQRNQILTFGLVPVNATACTALAVADLPRCVIEGNGGAVIPIATALQAEVDAAVAKIVLAVAGATSQFALTRSPITSTIKVKVRGMEVPRSRMNGFDYDAGSKSIIFFGTTFRPMMGDEVVISYRVWEGSIG